jgi:hypothetical protein
MSGYLVSSNKLDCVSKDRFYLLFVLIKTLSKLDNTIEQIAVNLDQVPRTCLKSTKNVHGI